MMRGGNFVFPDAEKIVNQPTPGFKRDRPRINWDQEPESDDEEEEDEETKNDKIVQETIMLLERECARCSPRSRSLETC